MAKRYRAKNKVRLSGFFYELDFIIFKATTITMLLRDIGKYLLKIDRIDENWQQHVLAELSVKYPGTVALEEVGRKTGGVSFLAARAFFKAAMVHVAMGEAFVSKAEAERRASICRACKERTNLTACGLCKKAVASMAFGVPERLDFGRRGFCGACGCSLIHKVWLTPKVLATDTRPITYHPDCWVPPVIASMDPDPPTEA